MGIIALMFAACTSDSEDGTSTNGMYEYSAYEIQQIQKMQEEYGVTFTFNTKSEKPLPSLKDFEELCKLVASINSTNIKTEKKGNLVISTTCSKIPTRSWNGAVEYSGSYHSSGTANNINTNQSYGYVRFTVTWSNTNSSGCGKIKVEVDECTSNGPWSLSYEGYSTSYEGEAGLLVILKFNASLGTTTVKDIQLREHISLTSSNN